MRLTRIIVAHRPETIRAAGRIIVLDHGRIIDDDDDRCTDPARLSAPAKA